LPGQVVLVLHGGGAIGAYQVGVYQALHDAGIEPDWVIGTSIGAINGALIAGNPPAWRMERLEAFWRQVEQQAPGADWLAWLGMGSAANILTTMARGIPGFFAPNPAVWQGPQARLGVDAASYYSTAPLRETLASLVDFDHLNACPTRFTVGAVNVRSGRMRYFDSRDERLGADHVMASGALPPAFPAIRLDGEDHMKDIDFTPAGVRARWRSGLDDTRAMIERAPWRGAFDPMEAVIEHVAPERQRSAPSASQRPA